MIFYLLSKIKKANCPADQEGTRGIVERAELHNVNVFTQTQIWVQNLPQKRVNCD